MNVGEAFAAFRQRLEISESEQKLASARHQEIRSYLRTKFDFDRDFLTGSYARHTKTKPLKDVDIFFVLKDTPDNRDKFDEASAVLEAFRASLGDEYGDSNVSLGRRSVKVDFDADEEVASFDVVSAFDRSNGGFVIPDSRLKSWIATDPAAHADAATAKNQELNGNWKPLVKMVKAWNRSFAESPIKPSFLLEVMALKIVDSPFSDYAYEAQHFFANAAERISEEWADPAGLGPAVDDELDEASRSSASRSLELAYRAAHEARRLERDESHSRAIEAWRLIFGDLFPAP